MNIQQITEQADNLCNLTNDEAYSNGLKLLLELRKYRKMVPRKKYKALEYKIQEQRFR